MKYIEILQEDLDHSKTLLFHATLLWRALIILSTNTIKANTFDKSHAAPSGPGVSLTRSYEYAKKHKGTRRPKIIFVLKNIPTMPVDYWTKGEKYRTEAEEWYPGAIDLSKYLISINSDMTIDEFRNYFIQDIKDMNFEARRLMLDGNEDEIREWLDSGYKKDIQYWNKWKPVLGITESMVSEIVPVLYHGTCKENAKNILKNGWQPNSGQQGGNMGQTKYLYLSTGYEDALWFANEKGCNSVIKVVNVPKSCLIVDPEDGLEDNLDDELNLPYGMPGKIALIKQLGPEHFSEI
jgi:hypothetical protein